MARKSVIEKAESMIGKINPYYALKFDEFDLEGNFIKEYPSYREAQRKTGINSIDVVCRGARQKGRKQVTAGGYIWKYREDIIQD